MYISIDWGGNSHGKFQESPRVEWIPLQETVEPQRGPAPHLVGLDPPCPSRSTTAVGGRVRGQGLDPDHRPVPDGQLLVTRGLVVDLPVRRLRRQHVHPLLQLREGGEEQLG